MKKGKIVSISHDLPDDGPFRSYKEIKRHWKNHYGYRLPEEEDDMIYYQINFRPLGERLFTYPELCLRGREIQRVPRVDPKPILIAFLQDLQKKIPNICGIPLKLHNKACYPTIDLSVVSQTEKRPKQNVTSKMPNNKPVYRNKHEVQILLSTSEEPCIPGQKYLYSTPLQQDTVVASNLKQCKTNSEQSSINANISKNEPSLSVEQRHELKNTNIQTELNYNEKTVMSNANHYSDITCTQVEKGVKKIPVFKSKVFSRMQTSEQIPVASQKSIPIFKSKQLNPYKSLSSQVPVEMPSNSINTTNVYTNMDKEPVKKLMNVPVFTAKKTNDFSNKSNVKQYTVNSSLTSAGLNKGHPKSLPVNQVIPNKEDSNLRSTGSISQSSGYMTPQTNKKIPLSGGHTPIQSTVHRINRPALTVPSTPQGKHVLSQLSTPHIRPEVVFPATPKSYTSHVRPLSASSTPLLKRPCSSSNECTPTMKKPRPKQQVQDVNVETLARSRQLNKVNTVTLVAWLKDRGVICKSKDKKRDLVEKTLKLLNLSVSEQ